MLPDIVEDHEVLYRHIPNKPSHVVRDNSGNFVRFSSSAFKDSQGASVDRDGKRDEQTIIEGFKDRLGSKCIVKVSAGTCRKTEAEVEAAPEDCNKFHALIVRLLKNPDNNDADPTKKQLTNSACKYLVEKSLEVLKPA